MQLIVLLIIAGAFLFSLWWIFCKTFLWTIDPLVKHFDKKDREQEEMHDALMEIKDELINKPEKKHKKKKRKNN